MKGPSDGGTFTLPRFFQGDTVPMQVMLLEPDPDGGPNDFVKVDIDDMALSLAVAVAPTGTAGGPSPLVTQYTWSKNASDKYFHANVAFNTTPLNDHLGASAEATDLFMEMEVTESSSITTIFQGSITVRAEVIEAGSAVVPAGETAMTAERADQIYARKFMYPGETITFQSEDEQSRRILGVRNDKSAMDDVL